MKGLTERQAGLCDLLWKSESMYVIISNICDADLRREIVTLGQLMLMDQLDDPEVLDGMCLDQEFHEIFEKMRHPPN